MKKVVLIGDSIRMGYDKYVKEALAGVCEVYYPEVNCKYAVETLRFVHEWKEKGGWPDDVDLVHWNCGLWDELELFEDLPLSTMEYYTHAVVRIHMRLRMLFPKAKIVFATSTAVLEEKCSKDFKRHNNTIEAYNEAAVRALSGTDAIINRLFEISLTCPEEYHSDAVHYYTDAGTQLLGGRVLSVLCRELDIKASEVNLESFSPEKYSKESIGY